MYHVVDECELCADFYIIGLPDPMFDLELRRELHMLGNVRIDKWNETLRVESARGALATSYVVVVARFHDRVAVHAVLNIEIAADNRLGKRQERFRVQQATGSG